MKFKMKTVHIIGAGGPAGVGMTRCLKEHYSVTGSDESQWAKLMMECPRSDLEVDLYIPLPDSSVRNSVGQGAVFLPPGKQIELCQDKAKTAEILGDLAPKVYWVRDTVGTGGKGAQMASEMLPGRNFSVEYVIYKGKVLAHFQKERISYSVKEKTRGLDNRGSSAVSVCQNYTNINYIAYEALSKLPGELNGFYGVDLKEDEIGVPRVTEINAGRLLTASYCYFYLTGYNLPLVGVKAFLGEEIPPLPDYPVGFGLIRQVGQEPKLFPPEITKQWYE